MKSNIAVKTDEFYTYLRRWIKRYDLPQQKFILLGHYRAGTTLLTDLLNSHPQIRCDGELFLPFVKLDYRKVLFPHVYINYHASKKKQPIYGFDLKVIQVFETLPQFQESPECFLQKLHQEGWKIIYLKRLNLLRQSISNLMARSRNEWHEKKDKLIQRQSVVIEVEKLMAEIEYHEDNLQKASALLKDIPHLDLTYESDLLDSENHQKTLDQIFSYLEIESVPVKSKHRKVARENIARDLKNYEEIEAFLSQTQYATFLET
ncbi:MAG: sulfotransferase [Cyanobacteriota bacterium]|nr:sulfotransferase [Cyanobacteriota bacterium]